MKRTLLLLLAAALLPAFSASAFSLVKSDKEKEELKGQVKTVKEYNLRKAEYFHADTVAKYRRLGKPLPKYERILSIIYTYDVKPHPGSPASAAGRSPGVPPVPL